MKKTLKIIVVAMMMLVGISCEDGLDINQDPSNPLDAPLTQILPAGQAGIAFRLSQVTGGISNAASVFSHQMVNFRVDQYALTGNSFTNDWTFLYANGLRDLESVIEKGTESEAWHYVGVAQVLKSFTFGAMVDVWGDVPYFEALKGSENFSPTYDNGQSVYTDLFLVLDAAIENLNKESTLSPAGDDVFYNGNISQWIRLANTIKLKLYLNVRLTSMYDANVVNQIIADGNFISSSADDFQFNYGTSQAPQNQNPAYQTNWAAASREMSISPFFYQRMQSLNDPRINYYWFNQLTSGSTAQNPTDFQDDTEDGLFVSFRFGAVGPNASFAQQNSQALLGLYPAGGLFNDQNGGTGGATSSSGNAPERFLTNYAVKFILAELALEEGATGDPRELFSEGIQAAFDKVNQVVGIVGAGDPTIAQADIDTYIADRLADYDAADDAGKLDLILQQKAIASFGWGIDSYNDIRRTGMPEIYDPNADGDVNTTSSRSFAVSYTYVDTQLSANPNAPSQRLPAIDKVFWDVN
ncbi:MAG: SusD/RagB family nutrient-binding outer membrane lipoprotein [Bacteroidota bacterium]